MRRSNRTDSILNWQACAKGQRFRLGPAELACPPARRPDYIRCRRLAAAVPVLLLCRAMELMPCWRDVRGSASNNEQKGDSIEPLPFEKGLATRLHYSICLAVQPTSGGGLRSADGVVVVRSRREHGRSWPNRRRAMCATGDDWWRTDAHARRVALLSVYRLTWTGRWRRAVALLATACMTEYAIDARARMRTCGQ